ncbi:MAG: hypothetical protein WCG27_12200, partial [Pseudomonadota bacterium]
MKYWVIILLFMLTCQTLAAHPLKWCGNLFLENIHINFLPGNIQVVFDPPTSNGPQRAAVQLANELINTWFGATGRLEIGEAYARLQETKQTAPDVFNAIRQALKIRVMVRYPDHLDRIPQTGGFYIVANHPLGFEPISIASVVAQQRPDIFIVATSLMSLPELAPHLIPVKIFGISNGDEKAAAVEKIVETVGEQQHGVVLLPAGSIARHTSPE